LIAEAFELLSNKYGNIWRIVRLGSIVKIVKHEEILRRFELYSLRRIALPVDEVSILPRKVVIVLKLFRYSIKEYFSFLEPAELREIEKKVPTKPEIIDLHERVITYLALDRRWSKVKNVKAIEPIVRCLRLSQRLFSSIAVDEGIPYANIGLVHRYGDYLRILREYKTEVLAIGALIGRKLGLIAFGGILSLRRLPLRKNLLTFLNLLERFCLESVRSKELRRVSWLIYGWRPEDEELKAIWIKLKELSEADKLKE